MTAMAGQGSFQPDAVLEVTRELINDVVAFIRARLDEMEQRARAVAELLASFDRDPGPERAALDPLQQYALSHGPQQELLDVAAMRRLLDHLLFMANLLPLMSRDAHAAVILATRWAWHPDYQDLIRRHAQPLDAPATPAPANGAIDA